MTNEEAVRKLQNWWATYTRTYYTPEHADDTVKRDMEIASILTALSAGEGTNPPPCPCCGNKETERASWACAQCGYNALAAPAPQEEQKPCDPWPNDGTDPLYCGPGGPCPKCNPAPPAREERSTLIERRARTFASFDFTPCDEDVLYHQRKLIEALDLPATPASAPAPRCRRCNDTGRIEVDYDDPSMLMGGQGTEPCPDCKPEPMCDE